MAGSAETVPDFCATCPARSDCAFASLPDDVGRRFPNLFQVRTYPRGRCILHQGERSKGVFLVRSGLVRLTAVESDGKLTILGLAGPASVLGLTEVISGTPNHTNAETVERCELDYLPRKDLVSLLRTHPELAVDLLVSVSKDLGKILQAFLKTSGKAVSSRDRVLDKLRELARTCGEPTAGGVALRIPLTVQDLAAHVGLSRQWTSKQLQDLSRRGQIRRTGRWIVLTQRRGDEPTTARNRKKTISISIRTKVSTA